MYKAPSTESEPSTLLQHVQPGEVFVTGESGTISTILGSCVAVCLWDKASGFSGMNHIILPISAEGEAASTRYANVGTYVLFDLMMEAGCRKENLVAKVFGGASGINANLNYTMLSVGSRNLAITFRVLARLEIQIAGQDIGGEQGRKIVFDTQTGKVRMNYLKGFDFRKESKLMES